ncbi:MAG: lipid A biosynthesis lauroyl acyltransferase [Xanthobacteraceae bacterium]|jgi:KDO2-lipid IV(A) lauroyltransferase
MEPRSKLLDATVGALAAGALSAVKRMDRKRTANFAGALMRRLGPLFPEHRLGRANLRAAFADKSAPEIEQILGGVWDNLGRIAVEFAHLDEFSVASSGPLTPDVITYAPETAERYRRLVQSGKPVLCFAAHLANWELPAVAGKLLGARTALLYRRPNIRPISDLIVKLREPLMGELVPTGLAAPVQLARLLQSGAHVGMLADQHFTRGVEVIFFGRRCIANPLIALLARQTGCPIHGVRVVRQPDGNSFSGEITDAVEPVRDAAGRVDIAGTMQAVTAVIEGWVREHPEQWLWLHRRWR